MLLANARSLSTTGWICHHSLHPYTSAYCRMSGCLGFWVVQKTLVVCSTLKGSAHIQVRYRSLQSRWVAGHCGYLCMFQWAIGHSGIHTWLTLKGCFPGNGLMWVGCRGVYMINWEIGFLMQGLVRLWLNLYNLPPHPHADRTGKGPQMTGQDSQ